MQMHDTEVTELKGRLKVCERGAPVGEDINFFFFVSFLTFTTFYMHKNL